MDQSTAQDLAETIADEVFKVGHSVEFARRLELMDERGAKLGGGWSREGFVRVVARVLASRSL